MSDVPRISVVVPVFNRAEHIVPCIDALLQQDYPDVEIIVVDNGSTDGTREVVSGYPVTLLEEPDRNAYRARNRGIAAAQGEIVAFTDSDCVADPSWLTHLAKHYASARVGGVGGHLVACPPETTVETFLAMGDLQIERSPRMKILTPDPHRFPSGAQGSANMSYRKAVLDAIGGFRADFRMHGGSYDLCWRVQAEGYDVVYEPAAVIAHRLRRTVRGMARQFYAAGSSQPYLLKQQAEPACYLKIKTYLKGTYEFRCPLPGRALMTVDVCSISILFVVLGAFFPVMLAGLPVVLLPALLGAAIRAREPVRRTGKWRWFVLYPWFHLVCSYAFCAGRIVSGVRYGVPAW